MKVCKITTRLGATYVFPDVGDEVEIPIGAGFSDNSTSLTIVNISGACLVLPWRVIDTIVFGEETIWTAPKVSAA